MGLNRSNNSEAFGVVGNVDLHPKPHFGEPLDQCRRRARFGEKPRTFPVIGQQEAVFYMALRIKDEGFCRGLRRQACKLLGRNGVKPDQTVWTSDPNDLPVGAVHPCFSRGEGLGFCQ